MRTSIYSTRFLGSVWSYLSCAFLLLIAIPIWSATITVDSLLDDVPGACPVSHTTLRCAIFAAGSGDTINFGVNGTIFIAGPGTQDAPLSINKILIIDASGHNITVSGNNLRPVIMVLVVGDLTLESITIANGFRPGPAGGIGNDGALTITNSTLSGNSASFGGGIFSNFSSTLTITNSTLAGNIAANSGGGILARAGSTVTITNSTLSGNSASIAGGGIFNDGNTTIFNTIVAKSTSGSDCAGVNIVTAGPDSIDSDGTCGGATTVQPLDLRLGPLANNGGPTQTVALLPGSVAIDAGNNNYAIAAGLIFDQRGPGFTRYSNGIVDVGAFEFQQCQFFKFHAF